MPVRVRNNRGVSTYTAKAGIMLNVPDIYSELGG